MSMVQKTAILLMLAIFLNAILFVFAWAYREIVFGLNPFGGLLGLLLSLLIAIPLAFLSVKWLAKHYKDRLMFSPAGSFLLGFFSFLTGDFIGERVFGPSTLDIQLHDTYFVIAHAHVMIFFALIFLAFSAAYFLYPRIFGRPMNAPMGYIHFGITVVASYLLCWPVHYDSLAGMPRRYINYGNWTNMEGFGFNVELKIILLFACAQLLFLFNIIYSAFKGAKWRPV